ncbi:putative endonuclease 4 [Termitomyces sp. T112]|nr:putative endonuclease 4 [Termitomyces sp. T112]
MVKTRRSSNLALRDVTESSEPRRKRIKLDTEPHAEISPAKKKRPVGTPMIDKSTFPIRRESPWKVGAHVSASGGVENTIINAAEIGANAFALFLKSQRKWTSPPLTSESIAAFKERMVEFGYSSSVILPHGSYLINLGNVDPEKREKSYKCFVDDLKRCEQLDLTLYNFHPGSTVGETTIANSISLVAECINRAHKETKTVTTVLETMAGAGNVIGCDFAHLGAIIAQVEDKSRVGVCLDTCHMFSAGYDIRKKEDWIATIEKFDADVGLSYLRGMHLNDSKTEHNSRKDRHENIGLGHIGITGFHHILNDPRVQHIPLVLETPSFELPKETWAREIEALNRLSGLTLEEDTTKEVAEPIRVAVKLASQSSGKTKPKRKLQATVSE